MREGESPIEEMAAIEEEGKRSYHIRVMRHAERLSSGELRPEGVQKAHDFGETLEDSAVVKGYASDEKSKRTIKTADLVTEGSGVTSPLKERRIAELEAAGETEKAAGIDPHYLTREVPDIQYGVVDPAILKQVSRSIDDATLKELKEKHGWDTEGLNLKKLPEDMPEEDKIMVGEIRQRHQEKGFELLLSYPEEIHKMAGGLAHQLVDKLKLASRKDRMDDSPEAENVSEGDVDINIVTHGIFSESIFKEAGVLTKEDGDTRSIEDFASIGGYFMPNESWYLDIKDPNNIPDRIPVVFEGHNRPERGKIFIDRQKLEQLDLEYQKLKLAKEEQKLVQMSEESKGAEELSDQQARIEALRNRIDRQEE